jgi:hypothetical protein
LLEEEGGALAAALVAWRSGAAWSVEVERGARCGAVVTRRRAELARGGEERSEAGLRLHDSAAGMRRCMDGTRQQRRHVARGWTRERGVLSQSASGSALGWRVGPRPI